MCEGDVCFWNAAVLPYACVQRLCLLGEMGVGECWAVTGLGGLCQQVACLHSSWAYGARLQVWTAILTEGSHRLMYSV